MTQRRHFLQFNNLLRNSQLSVISVGNLYDYGTPLSISGIAAGVCTVVGGDCLGKLVRTGKLVKDLDTDYVYEITTWAASTFTIHDTGLTHAAAHTFSFVTRGNEEENEYGPDLWEKTTSLKIYREDPVVYYTAYIEDNTKDECFYSLKCSKGLDGTSLTVVESLSYPMLNLSEKPIWYKKFAGRKVSFGCYIKTTVANFAKISISDGVTTTSSSYHSGGGDFEWLEINHHVSSVCDRFYVTIQLDNGIYDDTAYISHPILIFGDLIGEGAYFPVESDQVFFTSPIPSVSVCSIYNLNAQSSGVVPHNASAVFVYTNWDDAESSYALGNKGFYNSLAIRSDTNFTYQKSGMYAINPNSEDNPSDVIYLGVVLSDYVERSLFRA